MCDKTESIDGGALRSSGTAPVRAGTINVEGGERLTTAAVLFADIVGFTSWAEKVPPSTTMDFLRRYHEHMAQQVALHSGWTVQYAGDAILAAFGTDGFSPSKATSALACGFSMLEELIRWNARRVMRGRFPVEIGIGIHFGTVAIGKIGVAPRCEQTIAGDTVNVACRLEAMTRRIGTRLIVSGALVDEVIREGQETSALRRLTSRRECVLPGRVNQISIFALDGMSLALVAAENAKSPSVPTMDLARVFRA
jgi:class 3 adenylate cyclase